MVRSRPQLASVIPSGPKATAMTGPACPVSTPAAVPVPGSHSRTVPSQPPLASMPPADQATVNTEPGCPPSGPGRTTSAGSAIGAPGHGAVLRVRAHAARVLREVRRPDHVGLADILVAAELELSPDRVHVLGNSGEQL